MPIRINLSDETLFGNDAGEDETPEILASYFVDQESFERFLRPSTKLAIARAKKGMGKSALLSKFSFDRSAEGEKIIVKLVGSQLIGEKIPEFSTFLEAQSYWVRQICSRINSALGTQIGFAFNDTSMALVEAAEVTGLKGRSLVGALLSRIKSQHIPISIVTPTPAQPDSLLNRALEMYSETTVWLVVDDVDATYRDDAKHKLAVSSFFSALRYISNNMQGVIIRSSVRSDVWSNIREIEDLDKCEQYMLDISWTRLQLQHILCKKIWAWYSRNFPNSREALLDHVKDTDQIIELAFARRIKWGSMMVPPFQPINILSAGRPRWMSQLCRMAGANAHGRGDKITINAINEVMPDFTRYRRNDLIKEHKHQFEKLEQLLNIFINSPPKYNVKDLNLKILNEFILKVGVLNIPPINDEPYKSPLQLIDLLFQAGFLVARIGTLNNASAAEFKTYTDEPEMFKYGVPKIENMSLEIYPSYRNLTRTTRRRIV